MEEIIDPIHDTALYLTIEICYEIRKINFGIKIGINKIALFFFKD